MRILKIFTRKISQNILYLSLIFLILSIFGLSNITKGYYHYKIITGPGKYDENRIIHLKYDNIETFKDLSYIETILPNYKSKTAIFLDKAITINYDYHLKENEIYINENFSFNNSSIDLLIKNENNHFQVKGRTNKTNADIFISKEIFEKYFKEDVDEYNIVIDHYYNKKKFEEYLDSKEIYDYGSDTTRLAEIDELERQEYILTIISFGINIISIILLYFVYKNILNNEEKDIALLKSLGYNQYQIIIYIIKELIIFAILTIILQYLLIYIIKLIATIKVNNLFCYISNIRITEYLLKEIIIIIIIYFIISIESLIKIKRLNVFDSLNEE